MTRMRLRAEPEFAASDEAVSVKAPTCGEPLRER